MCASIRCSDEWKIGRKLKSSLRSLKAASTRQADGVIYIRCGPERCGASRTRRACVTASMPVRATFVAVFESASTARTWRPTTGRMRTGATKGLCRCTWAREKRARAERRLGRGRGRVENFHDTLEHVHDGRFMGI